MYLCAWRFLISFALEWTVCIIIFSPKTLADTLFLRQNDISNLDGKLEWHVALPMRAPHKHLWESQFSNDTHKPWYTEDKYYMKGIEAKKFQDWMHTSQDIEKNIIFQKILILVVPLRLMYSWQAGIAGYAIFCSNY